MKVQTSETSRETPVKESTARHHGVGQVVRSRLFLHSLIGNLLSSENRHIMNTWQVRIGPKVAGDTENV